ncbi:hypothetical protein KJ780_02995, partial [Candidatus Micrarchaeota archaeon]|nr:hypothetical protein [Candidatus Micrarchaeota archaeon]MBU1934975.1 hypothetical protein [Patescibacteria group bacterium]
MRFKIIVNREKKWAKNLGQKVANFIRGMGSKIVLKNEEVSIIIGGDGTIFFHKDNANGAIFAIGGKNSVVCQTKKENWKKK